jgi:HPt (histidine-containing phosphotransfer) domain-containing protein
MGSSLNPTPEEKIAAARSRLAELAEKFIERTRGEVDVMRSALEKLDAPDGVALAEILHLAHRISGTGATLGFDAVSEQARRVEQVATAQTPGTACDAATIETLRGGIEALATELAAARDKR